MKTGNSEVFKGRVSHKPLKFFYLILSIFLLVMISLPIIIGEEAYEAAATMGGFLLLMFLLVYAQASGRNTIYTVSEKGIYLKRLWLKDLLPFEEIEFVQKINEEETEEVAYMADDERVNAINEMDIRGAFKKQMEFGSLTQYSTVPFVGSESSGKNSYVIHSHSMDTAGDFIFIKGKNNKLFLISPLEMDDYLKAVVKYSKGKMTFEKGNSKKVIATAV